MNEEHPYRSDSEIRIREQEETKREAMRLKAQRTLEWGNNSNRMIYKSVLVTLAITGALLFSLIYFHYQRPATHPECEEWIKIIRAANDDRTCPGGIISTTVGPEHDMITAHCRCVP